MNTRRNINRGYMKLQVWQDAIELYKITWEIFKDRKFIENRIVSNQLSSVDSIQRNISEGYCRKSLSEYLHFLNIAKGSTGESVSSMNNYGNCGQVSEREYEKWDTCAYKVENGLIRLIESLERKRKAGDWITSAS